MTISPGSRLGPYEITACVGVGGMGEVYRATDTNLGRDVAIKVLPAALAADADRLARLEREARTLASLNHPNIAIVHGLERSGTTFALVMEFVSGPTLEERIAGAPLPIDEAVAIAKQIAGALEAAHDQGIIHRDLKPANIKVRPDGTVKVLDFGLAKNVPAGYVAGVQQSHSHTITSPAMTQAGIILGTAAYMSPEQATAKTVDKRSDVWAFGCVLYEMLTGRRTFEGAGVTETLAAVLEREPDWTRLPAKTPTGIRILLRRLLERDPRRRLHDIADARIELDDDARETASTTAARTTNSRTASKWIAALAVTAIVVGLGGWYVRSTQSAPLAVTRLAIPLDAPLTVEGGGVLALSPDGRHIAFVGTSAGRAQLYLRELDQFEARPIAGTDGAADPAFSPDGKWLAFAADRQIKKAAIAGGMPITVCDVAERAGLSWESNDSILFSPARGAGIWRVPSAGGVPSAVTAIEAGETGHDYPESLPVGTALLYSSNERIFVQSLAGGPRRAVGAGAAPRYLKTGHLIYVRAGTVLAVPFDVGRLETRGNATVVLQGVRLGEGGTPQIAFSPTGSMTYIPTSAGGQADTLVWVNRDGSEQPTALSAPGLLRPRLAPDLGRVAVLILGERNTSTAGGDLWLYDLIRDTRRRMTFDGMNVFPLWAPDGSRLAYSSTRTGQAQIHVMALDGTGSDETLPVVSETNYPLSWSPDGRFLAAVSVNAKTANDIWVYTLDKPPTPKPFVQTPFGEGAPTFSPDGRWIAYGSTQSGRSEIYMRPFPGPGEEWTISTEGGVEPTWARKTGQLFYRLGDAMMAVDIATTPTVTIGKPRRLFAGRYALSGALYADYDVTPDGQRFLMIKASKEDAPSRINVVLNWQEELKRLVPIN